MKARGDDWVSKSDVTRYVRCPYTFWLLYKGEIKFGDTVDEFHLRLLQEGMAFQDLVESTAAPVMSENLEVMLQQDVQLLQTPVFENSRLRIYGQPDGIVTARGALSPIEVKSHKDIKRTDELELAFYWLLLQPHRTRRVKQPRGYPILRREGVEEEVEVPIRRDQIDEVRALLEDVRRARREGVRPRICGCIVCSVVRRDEVLAAVWANEDLTLIHGIGSHYAPALERRGITSWRDLMACDPEEVVAFMRERRYYLSTATVEQWKCHATSYATGTPAVHGTDAPYPESFIALDLEYSSHTWLIGVCIVKGERRDHRFLWADDVGSLKQNLVQLEQLLAAEPSLPILTWNGDGADTPRLRKDAERAKRPELAASTEARHLDLFQYVWRNLRLPIQSLGLKEVAEYFGVSRVSPISGGLEALTLYDQYRRTKVKDKKARVREQLIAYNRDDLDALVEVASRVHTIMVKSERAHTTPVRAPVVGGDPEERAETMAERPRSSHRPDGEHRRRVQTSRYATPKAAGTVWSPQRGCYVDASGRRADPGR